MRVIEADQYPIYFTISDSDSTITPDMISKAQVKVNNEYFEYPNKGLYYDDYIKRWYFFLTQVKSIDDDYLNVEVQIRTGSNPPIIKGTRTKKIPINQGIIKEIWHE